MKVVEIQKIPVRTPDIPAVPRVEADGANLYGVRRDAHGVEDGFVVQSIEAESDVEVVADVRGRVVRVAVPRISIDVRLIQFAGVFAAEIGDCDSARVASVDVREDRRNDC